MPTIAALRLRAAQPTAIDDHAGLTKCAEPTSRTQRSLRWRPRPQISTNAQHAAMSTRQMNLLSEDLRRREFFVDAGQLEQAELCRDCDRRHPPLRPMGLATNLLVFDCRPGRNRSQDDRRAPAIFSTTAPRRFQPKLSSRLSVKKKAQTIQYPRVISLVYPSSK